MKAVEGPPASASSRQDPQAALEGTAMLLLFGTAIGALLIAVVAMSVIRRRWITPPIASKTRLKRLPDPWREAGRRMDKPPPPDPEEEPYQ